MFSERLQQVADRIEGTRALALIARDGIPVEWIDPHGKNLDLELLAAELMSQMRAISNNHEELEVGKVRHLAVATDQMTLMVTSITEEYYLMLVLGPQSNYGKARFELRRALLLFEDDLL